MKDLKKVPDDLLEMLQEEDPQFPLCTVECRTWRSGHSDCRECEHLTRCGDFIRGLEIGTKRTIKKFESRLDLKALFLEESSIKELLGLRK